MTKMLRVHGRTYDPALGTYQTSDRLELAYDLCVEAARLLLEKQAVEESRWHLITDDENPVARAAVQTLAELPTVRETACYVACSGQFPTSTDDADVLAWIHSPEGQSEYQAGDPNPPGSALRQLLESLRTTREEAHMALRLKELSALLASADEALEKGRALSLQEGSALRELQAMHHEIAPSERSLSETMDRARLKESLARLNELLRPAA